MPLQQGPRFYIPPESTCCLLIVYAISCVTGNHTMDLFYLLKENFKSLIYNSLITVKYFDKFA